MSVGLDLGASCGNLALSRYHEHYDNHDDTDNEKSEIGEIIITEYHSDITDIISSISCCFDLFCVRRRRHSSILVLQLVLAPRGWSGRSRESCRTRRCGGLLPTSIDIRGLLAVASDLMPDSALKSLGIVYCARV